MRSDATRAPRVALCLLTALFAVPAFAGPPQSSQGRAARAERGKCEIGQVPVWSGHGWVCGSAATGGAPQVIDAGGAAVGPVMGTALVDGVTVPRVLFALDDGQKPFLLAVDESGFLAGGRLLVRTTNEAQTCASGCGVDLTCLTSCLSATPACDASNAYLEAPPPASALFRVGAVVRATSASADLWAATSAASQPIGECFDQGIPACALVVYHPQDDTCTAEVQLGTEPQSRAYPAVLVANLHALHVPPYALRVQ
jgi:hypothetical protein